MDFKEYFTVRNRDTYEREEFDNFLKKEKFVFNVPSIHIAGSNGKGSTAYYLSYIYTLNGYKTALFTSPYYQSPVEMIKINNQNIPEEKFEKYLNEYKKLFDKYDLSEFEIEAFIALKYFQDEKCDIAIIECGMGGEYDATNIFTPILSIITSISLEHTNALGRSLSEIALHKAGIIKEEAPVLIDKEMNEEALLTITNVAKENRSKIYVVERYHFEKRYSDRRDKTCCSETGYIY